MTSVTPAVAGASPSPDPGIRVVGTVPVAPSRVGVIVAVPGASGPLTAPAFRLWQDGQPEKVRVSPLPASALRLGVVVDAGPGAQLQGAQNAVADLMIGLPAGAEAAVVGARPARLVQPLTGDAGSVVQALADATFSGPADDEPALKLAVREVLKSPAGRRAVVLITTGPVPAGLATALSGPLKAAHASLYIAAVPAIVPSLASLAGSSGGWTVTASSARALLPAVDAVGADLVHQYQLAYTTAVPPLTTTRLRVAVAGAGTAAGTAAGTTATTEATVRIPARDGAQARAQAPSGPRRHGGISLAWPIAAVLLLGLAAAALFERRRQPGHHATRHPGPADGANGAN